VWSALEAAGAWDDTFILVTADHGEHLGDHGLLQKGGFLEQSYHILGIARDPRPGGARGAVVEAFTENVDVFPTLCEAMDIGVPAQCDGTPLTPFLRGEAPPWWRVAAHWEYDWRFAMIADGPSPWPWDRRLERQNLAVHRDETGAYVHFGDGSSLCFDLAVDPSWRTAQTDPAAVLAQAQAMLTWRARHSDRTLTGMLMENGGIGRWPAMPADWGSSAFETLDALEAWLDHMARSPSDEAPGISELDHGLQCAAALRAMAPDDVELCLAGLLHDIGHGRGHIRDHAWTGAEAVRPVLGDRIAELIGLHIEAKRYLVTTDAGYRARLSPASIETLALQGGDMTSDEVARFETWPHWRAALDLRRADEAAKTPGRAVPGLDYWLPALRAAVRPLS
jgi:predicted HD phosphohydrolase